MRVALPWILTVLCVGAWLLYRMSVKEEPSPLVAQSKRAAEVWSAAQRPQPGVVSAPAVLIPSEQCRDFNVFVVGELNEMQQNGLPPPFGTAPLMEVLRSGNCDQDNASVRVLLGWIESAKKMGTTPRNNEP
mgnify:CR=1 FL=1